MPNINLSDKPKDLINQTKFPFNQDKFNSYTSYSNYDFTNTIYLEEEKEEKYKSLPFILSDIFSFDKLDSFDKSIDGDDINSKENIYHIFWNYNSSILIKKQISSLTENFYINWLIVSQ